MNCRRAAFDRYLINSPMLHDFETQPFSSNLSELTVGSLSDQE